MMESTAFLSRSRRPLLLEEPAIHGVLFCAGQEVQIKAGPLAGMQGTLVKRSADGRWVVQFASLASGVLLCTDENHLEGR